MTNTVKMFTRNCYFSSLVCFHFLVFAAKDVSCLSFEGHPCIENNLRVPGVCQMFMQCRTATRLYYERGISLGLCSMDFGIPVVCCPDGAIFKPIQIPTPKPQTTQLFSSPVVKETPQVNPTQIRYTPQSKHFLHLNKTVSEEPPASVSNTKVQEILNILPPTYKPDETVYGGKPTDELNTRVEEEEPESEDSDAGLPYTFPTPGRPTSIWPGEKNTIISKGHSPRISQIKCEDYHEAIKETKGFPTNETDPEKRANRPPTCFTTGGYIIGGREVNIGEYPFMAAVGWPTDDDPPYRWLCGGSLISERFVLSAGHCAFTRRSDVTSKQPTVVRLGDHNLEEGIEDYAYPMTYNISKITKHPDYKAPKKYHDLALFELDTDVKFNFYIRPICLWTEEIPYDSIGVAAAGWGLLNPKDTKTSDVLMSVDLTIFDSSVCSKNFPTTRNWDGFLDSNLCAGSILGGKDTCKGDSGGPLIYKSVRKEEKCRFYLIAVTSFGNECGSAAGSGVYTKVFGYLDWIEKVVWPDKQRLQKSYL